MWKRFWCPAVTWERRCSLHIKLAISVYTFISKSSNLFLTCFSYQLFILVFLFCNLFLFFFLRSLFLYNFHFLTICYSPSNLFLGNNYSGSLTFMWWHWKDSRRSSIDLSRQSWRGDLRQSRSNCRSKRFLSQYFPAALPSYGPVILQPCAQLCAQPHVRVRFWGCPPSWSLVNRCSSSLWWREVSPRSLPHDHTCWSPSTSLGGAVQ